MKTVYLDNNCYKRLLDNRDEYDFLLSLSHNRRGLLSFESSLATLGELSLIWKSPERDVRYKSLVRPAHRLVRRDRCIRDVVDLIEQEVAIALGERPFFDLWYHSGSEEHALWGSVWREVCDGKAPRELTEGIDQAKAEYVKLFDEIREEFQARLKNVTDEPVELGTLIHRYVRRKGLDFMAHVAQRQFPRLPSSLDEMREIVATHLHALRTELGVYEGFGFARLAPNVNQITVDRSMKRRGRHEGSEFYDARHATYGRYVDYFIVEDVTLRFIINSLDERNYRSVPYRALSLSEFLEEARRLAHG